MRVLDRDGNPTTLDALNEQAIAWHARRAEQPTVSFTWWVGAVGSAVRHRVADYTDKPMVCPECMESFVWAARQQFNRANNVMADLTNPDAPITCSRSCAMKSVRRRVLARKVS